MGWASETSRGVTTITGPIGDPLAIQIVAEFVGNATVIVAGCCLAIVATLIFVAT